MAVSKISVNPSARYDSFRLYGLSVIWPEKADFGRLINSVRLYGRPYNRKRTVLFFTTKKRCITTKTGILENLLLFYNVFKNVVIQDLKKNGKKRCNYNIFEIKTL